MTGVDKVWVVTREGPEWTEIVGIYSSESSAITKTERCRLHNKGSKDVMDTLSGYAYRAHEVKP